MRRKKFKVGDRVMVTSLYGGLEWLLHPPKGRGARGLAGLRGEVVRARRTRRGCGYPYWVKIDNSILWCFYPWELRRA